MHLRQREAIHAEFLFTLVFCAVACGLVLSPIVHAQYPDRAIRIVVPFPPGNAPDLQARMLGERFTTEMKQPVIVENRPGAAGVLAVQAVTGAAPDGHTLLVHGSAYLISKAVQPGLAIDPVNELAPAAQIYAAGPIALLVGGGSSARNVEDLVDRLKATPGKLSYGSAGVGLIHHLTGELLLNATRTQALHIPFKGPDLYTALIRGEVDFTVSPLTVIMPLVKAGKMRVLATMNSGRMREMPDVRTLNEVYKNDLLVMEFWAGLAAPVKTPVPVLRAVHAATVRALEDPVVRNAIETGLNTPTPDVSTEAFAAFVRRENDKLREIVKLTGIKAE